MAYGSKKVAPGVTKFIELKDTPDSYTGQAGKLDYVKTAEDGLEFLGQKAVGFKSAARAYLGTAWSLPSGAWTVIPLDTENFDTLGEFDPSTHRFTAQEAGAYLVVGEMKISAAAVDGQRMGAVLYVNGSVVTDNMASAGAAVAYLGCAILDVLNLAAGDYIELKGMQDSGAAQALHNQTQSTFLSVHRIG